MPFGRAGCLGASQSAGHLNKIIAARQSGLGAGGLKRDGTGTQAERRPDCRGMQAAKLGHD